MFLSLHSLLPAHISTPSPVSFLIDASLSCTDNSCWRVVVWMSWHKLCTAMATHSRNCSYNTNTRQVTQVAIKVGKVLIHELIWINFKWWRGLAEVQPTVMLLSLSAMLTSTCKSVAACLIDKPVLKPQCLLFPSHPHKSKLISFPKQNYSKQKCPSFQLGLINTNGNG